MVAIDFRNKGIVPLFILLNMLYFNSCIPHRMLEVENLTDRPIRLAIQAVVKSDTASYWEESRGYSDCLSRIDAHSSYSDPMIGTWEGVFQSNPGLEIRLLFVSEDTIKRYGCDIVIKDKKFEKKIIISSYKELKQMNFKYRYKK